MRLQADVNTRPKGQTHMWLCLGLILLGLAPRSLAADQPQWGERFSRNMVSQETGLAARFDPAGGQNIKWKARLGSETWSTPIVAQGKVFIGTNNTPPRDKRHQGDRGVLLCLDERDGQFLWQLVVPKLSSDPYLDWPKAGIVSPVTVEGERVYVVSNRGEVICLDIHGQSNGNDGPYQGEAGHMTVKGEEALAVTQTDADILWLYDIPQQAGTHPHDAAHASILLDGDLLYVNTSNAVDNTHRHIRFPQGPSLIVLDKNTGRLLARDHEGIGPRIYHSTWSSPALGLVNGQKRIFFGGGDGVMYGFAALDTLPAVGEVKTLKRVWRFDCDPLAPKENVHQYKDRNRRAESPSNIKGMPVFHNQRVYVAVGGDIWWGKKKAWLQCIDASGAGDVTESGLQWSYAMDDHCCATPAVYQGMVFIADCSGILHCVDAQSGQGLWTHQAKGAIWASPLIADGKCYIGCTYNREFYVLAAGRKKEVLSQIRLDRGMAGTVTAANGVLYVPSMRYLYAIAE